jgi:cell division transport system permease protein
MSDVLTSLRRTPYQTFAAFSVLFITLLLSGLLFISLSFIQGLLNYVETRPRVIVYFQIKAEESEISKVKEKLEDTGKVANIKYVSKSEAYNIYKQFTKNDPLLLEMTSPDILPASLEIDAKKPEDLPEIADFVKNQAGVDEVQFQKDIVDNLLNLTTKVRQATLVFFTYLMFMSIVVLTTTTSFKIALKKDEITLLNLLGASKYYIRRPFIKESVFLGIIASIFANVILIGILLTLNTFMDSYFSGVPALAVNLSGLSFPVWPFNVVFAVMTILVTTVFSLIITLVASLTATNRYL